MIEIVGNVANNKNKYIDDKNMDLVDTIIKFQGCCDHKIPYLKSLGVSRDLQKSCIKVNYALCCLLNLYVRDGYVSGKDIIYYRKRVAFWAVPGASSIEDE